MGLREMESVLPPGFRFYPSDEELVCFYLRNKVTNQRVASGTLVEVDLHAREPWELPDVAKLTAVEWYFFSFRDRKYATGSRTNRATKMGYWKATGKDRIVHDPSTCAMVGMRKTLVFYRGRAPNGHKTGWVMHEFRLETPNSIPKEDWVLCRVFNKMKPSEDGEQSSSTNHATTGTGASGPSSLVPAFHASPPEPTAVDKLFYQQRQAATTGNQLDSDGSAGALLMDLQAMLQQDVFLDYYSSCSPMVRGDDLAIGPHGASCGSVGGDGAVTAVMGLGHVGPEGQGMGEIEMEYSQPQGGGCYRDGLYF